MAATWRPSRRPLPWRPENTESILKCWFADFSIWDILMTYKLLSERSGRAGSTRQRLIAATWEGQSAATCRVGGCTHHRRTCSGDAMAPGSGPGRSGSCIALAEAAMSMTLRFLPIGFSASAAFAWRRSSGSRSVFQQAR